MRGGHGGSTTPDKLLQVSQTTPVSLTKEFHDNCEEYITFLERQHQLNLQHGLETEQRANALRRDLDISNKKLSEVVRLCTEQEFTLEHETASDLRRALLGLGLARESVGVPRYDKHRDAVEVHTTRQESLLSDLQGLESRARFGGGGDPDLLRSLLHVEQEVFAQHEEVSRAYDSLLGNYIAMADRVRRLKAGLARGEMEPR